MVPVPIVPNSEGQQVSLFEYQPWGESSRSVIDPLLGEANATRYKFTGQEEDPEVALYFYNARYYDPELGRFIQADSIVQEPFDPQSLNRYTYCRNNPVNFIDPSGNFWGLFAAIGGWIAGAVSAVGGALSAAGGAAVGAAKAVGGALASLGHAAGGLLSGLTSSQAAVSTANSGALKLVEQGVLVGQEGQLGGFLKFGYEAGSATAGAAGSSSAAQVGSMIGQILGGAVDSLFGAQAAWAMAPQPPREGGLVSEKEILSRGRKPTAAEATYLREIFPKLGEFRITGEETDRYNCIAWSMGVSNTWINPDRTVAQMDKTYSTYGYYEVPENKARLALFVKDGVPKHGAKKLFKDWYESKLGQSYRIIHKLRDLEGDLYGEVDRYYGK